MSESRAETLTRGGLLARNMLYNLVGQGAPLLAGLVALPLLYGYLGDDRFGVLLLVWTVIGYSGLFNLGLSRALTKLVADELGKEREDRVAVLSRTALLLMGLIGLAGSILLVVVLPLLVRRNLLNVPSDLHTETIHAFYLLAVSVPFVVCTAGLRGILEAYQRFDVVNAVRIPFGIFNFIGPLCALPFSSSLVPVVAVLVGGRVLATLVHAGLCLHVVPAIRQETTVERAAIRPLLHFGTWVTVTTGGATLVIYLERILIGVLLPVAAIGYFATPYDLVTKVMIIPAAVVSVLFPAFSTHLSLEPVRATRLFEKGVRYVFIMLFPVALVIVTLAHEGLALWMGEQFAIEAGTALQWLMAGGFFSAISYLPVTLLHSAGRPDITGKLFLVYFPIYMLVIWWLIPLLGIEGVALAHAARLTGEGIFLFLFARRFLPASTPGMKQMAVASAAAMGAFALAAFWPENLIQKGLLLVLLLPVFILAAWRVLLHADERSAVWQRIQAIRRDV